MHVADQSQCLYATSTNNKTFHRFKAFITVKGKPSQIFGMDEGPGWVSGYAQGAEGAQFSVTLYDGREGKSGAKGYKAGLSFGDEKIWRFLFRPGEVTSMKALPRDAQGRFFEFKEYRRQVRPYQFAKIPTTDDARQASTDDDFLNNISVVKIEVRQLKQAPKKPEKKAAAKKKVQPWEEPESEDDDPLERVDDRLLDEKTDKGQFALNASYGDLVDKPAAKGGSSSSWSWQYVNKSKVDFTFTFRIRSQAWVQNFLDPDRTPTPPRSPHTPPRELAGTLYLDFDADEAQTAHETAATSSAHAKQDALTEDAHADKKRRVSFEEEESVGTGGTDSQVGADSDDDDEDHDFDDYVDLPSQRRHSTTSETTVSAGDTVSPQPDDDAEADELEAPAEKLLAQARAMRAASKGSSAGGAGQDSFTESETSRRSRTVLPHSDLFLPSNTAAHSSTTPAFSPPPALDPRRTEIESTPQLYGRLDSVFQSSGLDPSSIGPSQLYSAFPTGSTAGSFPGFPQNQHLALSSSSSTSFDRGGEEGLSPQTTSTTEARSRATYSKEPVAALSSVSGSGLSDSMADQDVEQDQLEEDDLYS
ncbi:hypothetical protein JCM8097_003195 [Rhodosporidiobolus ruineniae]